MARIKGSKLDKTLLTKWHYKNEDVDVHGTNVPFQSWAEQEIERLNNNPYGATYELVFKKIGSRNFCAIRINRKGG